MNKTLILSIVGGVFLLISYVFIFYKARESGYQDGYIEASDSKNCGKSESPWK